MIVSVPVSDVATGGVFQEEAARLVKDVFRVYFDTAEYKQVEALNTRPAAFDWQAFIRAQLAWPAP